MGLQNAVVTRISNARVRTTHISGMATDIGIGLGLLLDMACGGERTAERETVLANLRLHGMTILCFLAGGLAGGLIYRGGRHHTAARLRSPAAADCPASSGQSEVD